MRSDSDFFKIVNEIRYRLVIDGFFCCLFRSDWQEIVSNLALLQESWEPDLGIKWFRLTNFVPNCDILAVDVISTRITSNPTRWYITILRLAS